MMIQRHILICILLLTCSFGRAQHTVVNYPHKIDSVKKLIDAHSNEDEEKVVLLNEYARLCIYNSDFMGGLKATHQARVLSEKLNFKGGQVMYYLTLSSLYGSRNIGMGEYYSKQAEWLSNSMGGQQRNYYVSLDYPEDNLPLEPNVRMGKLKEAYEYFVENEDREIQGNILIIMAYINTYLGNNNESLKADDRAIELFTVLNQVYPIFFVSTHKMNTLRSIGKLDEAKKIESDLVKVFLKNENEKTIGLISNTLASGYSASGRHLLAVEYYLKSIDLFEHINDREMLMKTYYDLAITYESLNLNNKAYEYYLKSIRELEKSPNKENVNLAYGSLVFPTIALEKYDEAKKYMALALQDTTNGLKEFLLGRFNDANGQIYKKQGKYAEAIPHFKSALNSFAKSNISWTSTFMPLYLAECYYQIGDYKTALNYALRCLELESTLKLNQPLTKKRASLWVSKIYEQLGNTSKAYEYLKINQGIAEESEKLNELNRIADMEIQSILDKTKKEIEISEQERLEAYQQNRIQRMWILSITGALLSVFVVTIILYRNNRNKLKANALLTKQKEEIQLTLSQLKAAQSQLIQSEKMASLGELTAGIAHEIQNPLNFVNNFSEVSNELIDEMKTELDKGDLLQAKSIAEDVKQNLTKISHHGKRADAIVKGMLQHSRSSSGVKEPTNINALADEYLRLAYHGFRAKDKSFNATMNTDYDETIEPINVIPQDIGRVILNLITNAFYAVNEKRKAKIEGYEPTVTVNTKKEGNKVLISVKDNGKGIPESIKYKIFQPFFTTKPTGQGTGLGLSLSYDIVKAHGGELQMESGESRGSEFIIELPNTTY